MSKQDILDRLAGTPVIKCGRLKDGCHSAHLLWARHTETVLPPHQSFEILNRDGWRLNTNPALDRCPTCITNGYGAEEESEPPPTTIIASPPELVVTADPTASEKLNDLFDRVLDMANIKWSADEYMYLGVLTAMLSEVNHFIEFHFKELSPLNQIALREACEATMSAMERAAGLGSLLEEKDKKIEHYKDKFLKALDEIKKLRTELANKTFEVNELNRDRTVLQENMKAFVNRVERAREKIATYEDLLTRQAREMRANGVRLDRQDIRAEQANGKPTPQPSDYAARFLDSLED
jgi:hypothetical protein